MKAARLLLIVAGAAAGCGPAWERDEGDARHAEREGKFGTCVTLQTEALERYEALERVKPSHSAEHREGREGQARALAGRGRCWRAGGRLDDAIADLQESCRRAAALYEDELNAGARERLRRELDDCREDLAQWRRERARGLKP